MSYVINMICGCPDDPADGGGGGGGEEMGSLALEKVLTNPDEPLVEGAVLSYTFTVTNTGTVAVDNITLTDAIATVSGGPIASLAAGAADTTTFTATYTLTAADVAAGGVTNTASAGGTDASGNAIKAAGDAVYEGECLEVTACELYETANSRDITATIVDPVTATFVDNVTGASWDFSIANATNLELLDVGTAGNGNQYVRVVNNTGDLASAETNMVYNAPTKTSPGGCAIEIFRMDPTWNDIDEQQESGIPTCVTVPAGVVPSGGSTNRTWTNDPAGSNRWCLDAGQGPATPGGGEITETFLDPVDGQTWPIQWEDINATEIIAFRVAIWYRLYADVTRDCTGAFVSAVDVDGNPLTEGDLG